MNMVKWQQTQQQEGHTATLVEAALMVETGSLTRCTMLSSSQPVLPRPIVQTDRTQSSFQNRATMDQQPNATLSKRGKLQMSSFTMTGHSQILHAR